MPRRSLTRYLPVFSTAPALIRASGKLRRVEKRLQRVDPVLLARKQQPLFWDDLDNPQRKVRLSERSISFLQRFAMMRAAPQLKDMLPEPFSIINAAADVKAPTDVFDRVDRAEFGRDDFLGLVVHLCSLGDLRKTPITSFDPLGVLLNRVGDQHVSGKARIDSQNVDLPI
jgi:hypothetical protein